MMKPYFSGKKHKIFFEFVKCEWQVKKTKNPNVEIAMELFTSAFPFTTRTTTIRATVRNSSSQVSILDDSVDPDSVPSVCKKESRVSRATEYRQTIS